LVDRVAVDHIRRLWTTASDRLEQRLAGMTDAEYFWQPAGDCWTVHPTGGTPQRWTIDYDWPPPAPPPVTTIAWRMVHIANGNTIYFEHAFGPGVRTFMDLEPPHTASTATDYLTSSCSTIAAWLECATDADLPELRPSHLGPPRAAGDVMCTLLDELVHHGAEIGLLRDLYRRQHG
jgi:hypothetical protein